MSATPLPRSTPSAEGADAAGVLSFIDALEAVPEVEPHSLVVVRRGRVIAEGWWAPYSPEQQRLLYSVSKSFTATAVGLAIAEGLVDLDRTVLSYFPELDSEVADPRSRRMLVRHVAAMASGHLEDVVERAELLDPADMVRGFLLIPPDEEPGGRFVYNQPCTFALAAIVQRVSGQSLTEYLRPRLFDPLGVGAVSWRRDASGREIGFSGLHATTEDVAKLGLLYLGEGVFGGERLLAASWVAEATRTQIDNPDEASADNRVGYGFQFWTSRHGYRADGAYGQLCLVLPEHDAVVVVTSQSRNAQAVMDAAWQHLLPAFDAPGDPAADVRLAERTRSLALPALAGAVQPHARRFTAAAGNDQPSLTSVELTAGGIRLDESGTTLEVALGDGEWTVTGVIAASGGWDAAGETAAVDLVFLETPHRLRLRCDASAGVFTARWVTEPLHVGPLAALRAPLTANLVG